MTAAFFIGAKFGELTLKGRVRVNIKHPYNTRKRWRCVCSCGEELTIPEFYLIRKGNPKVDCGHGRKTNKTLYNQEFRIWLMMHERTENETHVSYKHYGGRGIKVCAEWHKDSEDEKGFDRFLEYIGPRPGPEFTVDRIDNDLGYQPFQGDGTTRQVRWATMQQQSDNKGRK